MSLDWPNLTAGGVIGFIVGFCANAAYARYHTRRAKAELKRRFEGIEGDYVAYRYLDRTDYLDYDNPIGRAHLSYERENILLLRYEEINEPNIWEAVIWMETPFFGSMAWRYVKLAEEQPATAHRYGFKRCVISEAPDKDGRLRSYFYLVGENEYGREALEKQVRDDRKKLADPHFA